MKCDKVQIEVLQNNTADEELTRHLRECDECRFIAEAMELFITAKPDVNKYKIPKEIDASITSEAKAFIDERTSSRTLLANPMVRPFHTWASVFAYAACFILVAWMLVIALSSGSGNQPEIKTTHVAVNPPLSQEIKDWNNLDMGEDIFILNTEIEINFAALSFFEENEEVESDAKEQEEVKLEIPDLMI